jgi:hypothetical protein
MNSHRGKLARSQDSPLPAEVRAVRLVQDLAASVRWTEGEATRLLLDLKSLRYRSRPCMALAQDHRARLIPLPRLGASIPK